MNPPSSLSSIAHELFSASLGQTRASVPRVLLHMEMRSVVRGSSLPVYSWPIWSDRQLGEVGRFQSSPGRPHPLVVALHKHGKQSLKWRFFLPPSRFKALPPAPPSLFLSWQSMSLLCLPRWLPFSHSARLTFLHSASPLAITKGQM